MGICGTAVVEQGRITSIRDITSMNVRIAKESFGIANPILKKRGNSHCRWLIDCWKARQWKNYDSSRFICRQVASGGLDRLYRVSLVDERGEVAGISNGEVQNDVGVCCDILNGYPKSEGILQAIRGLSPQFIFCDELGDND